MNTSILNREFKHPADGWYHIEPKGEHEHPGAGVVQVIDEEAVESIVKRFNEDAAAGRLSHGQEMLIDHEHFKHDGDKETRAYGWLQSLQSRADGIYGRIRWTRTGQAAVDGGDYRFFSTEYDPKETRVLTEAQPAGPAPSGQRLRPLRLDWLTWTNQPNNRGQRPITNRSPLNSPLDSMIEGHQLIGPLTGPLSGTDLLNGTVNNDLADVEVSAVNQFSSVMLDSNKKPNMKNIANKLGLATEASEEAVLEALTRIQNRNATLEPLAAENTTLKQRIQQLDEEGINALLARRNITEPKIINRLKPVLANYETREERLAFLDDCGFGGEAATPARPNARLNVQSQTKLFNRETKPPQGGRGADGDAAKSESITATRIMNRAQEIKRQTPNVTEATAVIMAQREMEQAAS